MYKPKSSLYNDNLQVSFLRVPSILSMFHEVFRFLPREQSGFAFQDPEIKSTFKIWDLFQTEIVKTRLIKLSSEFVEQSI